MTAEPELTIFVFSKFMIESAVRQKQRGAEWKRETMEEKEGRNKEGNEEQKKEEKI